jgi:hypothetical protein
MKKETSWATKRITHSATQNWLPLMRIELVRHIPSGVRMKVMTDPTVKPSPAPIPPTASVQLDEAVWLAWVQKNRERDRISFARRVRVIKYLLVLLALGAVIWRYTQ